ncbi:MAG TPA: alcohol dehydrogenase-like regulatory protein ErcA, partial [Syntrophomonadaceae bacterium]|nr:alcohol dehydrogenase-like regulatory protein ErcA [Syntrophomonadaceae bacterium]
EYESGLRKFVNPELVFGSGARSLAGRYAKNLGARKVLVVSDPGIHSSGWIEEVTTSIESVGIPFTIFTAVSPNPRAEEVMNGAEVYLSEHCNMIVAVGGGSPLDCAKGIGIVSSNGNHILDYQGIDKIPLPMPPLICIPTTGVSADVSQFAVILDRQQKLKVLIGSKSVVSDVALIDPDTMTTMSPHLLACTSLDALTHAIEAFVSNAHSPMTDIHALESISLITSNLLPAIKDPTNLAARGQIMLGSLEAGLAFSNAILGATHSLAHSLGGFLDLPHGECTTIFLKHVMAFNFSAATDRYRRIGETMGLDLRGMGSSEIQKAILSNVEALQKAVGIDLRLAQLGVNHSDISLLARNALHDPCLATNPRRTNQRDLEVLYEEAF